MKPGIFCLAAACCMLTVVFGAEPETYRVVSLQGDCNVREASGPWRPVAFRDSYTSASELQNPGESLSQVYVRKAGTQECFLIRLQKSEFALSRLAASSAAHSAQPSMGGAIASFTRFVLAKAPETVISHSTPGAGMRDGTQGAKVEVPKAMLGSLNRKLDGVLDLDKFVQVESDYPLDVQLQPAADGGQALATISNLSERTLYAALYCARKKNDGSITLLSLNNYMMVPLPPMTEVQAALAVANPDRGTLVLLAGERAFNCWALGECVEAGSWSNAKKTYSADPIGIWAR